MAERMTAKERADAILSTGDDWGPDIPSAYVATLRPRIIAALAAVERDAAEWTIGEYTCWLTDSLDKIGTPGFSADDLAGYMRDRWEQEQKQR